jgi:DNA-directed RNA polymerase delta subunit
LEKSGAEIKEAKDFNKSLASFYTDFAFGGQFANNDPFP